MRACPWCRKHGRTTEACAQSLNEGTRLCAVHHAAYRDGRGW